jgi:hypothetical protein
MQQTCFKTPDAWGAGIVLQSLNLPPGAVHLDTPPVSPLEFSGPTVHPYDAALLAETNRAARVHAAAMQHTRQGGYRAITAASRMLRIFRRNFLSRSAQVDAHDGIHNFVCSHLCMKSKRFWDRSPDVNQKPW